MTVEAYDGREQVENGFLAPLGMTRAFGFPYAPGSTLTLRPLSLAGFRGGQGVVELATSGQDTILFSFSARKALVLAAQTVSPPRYPQRKACLPPQARPPTRERLRGWTRGCVPGKSAAPAQIARALHRWGLSQATPQSLERRIRRVENDPCLREALCLPPVARAHLALGKPARLLLVLDPSSQQEWQAPHGQTPVYQHHVRAFVFAPVRP